MKKFLFILIFILSFCLVCCSKSEPIKTVVTPTTVETERTKQETVEPTKIETPTQVETETKEPTIVETPIPTETETPVHVHDYFNGVCKECLYECPHEQFKNGYCVECGISKQSICHHEFEDGFCYACGYECPHEEKENGICKICGMSMEYECEHHYENSVCVECGFECQHKHYKYGICIKCGYECQHPGHTCGETCDTCHIVINHEFVNNQCTRCGFMDQFVTTIPAKYLDKNCPQKGTVEKVVWQSYDYANKRRYENTFFVYLPYGYYESNQEYNVMYLLHGSGENSAYWLAQLSYAGGTTEQTRYVLDNMHYYGLCEPTIVVTPTSNLNGTTWFYKELVEEIMPQAETRYRTKAHIYGKSISAVSSLDFMNSREYRAYAGLSRGSMIGWSVVGYDLAYFGYFGFYSGGSYGLTAHLNKALATVGGSDYYPIYYAYHSCGDNDAMYNNHVADYNSLLSASKGRLIEHSNTDFFVKPGFTHSYKAWIVDLYNSLGLRFFKYSK